jgi:nitrogen regulatory protein PII
MVHLVTAIIKPHTLEFVPKVKLDLLVDSGTVDKVFDTKVWAVEVGQAMRVRTGELGADAL